MSALSEAFVCKYCLKMKTSVPWCLWWPLEQVDSAGGSARGGQRRERCRKWAFKRQRAQLVSDTVAPQLCGVSVSRLVSVSQRILLWLSKRLPPPHTPPTPHTHTSSPPNAVLLLVPRGPWTSPTLLCIALKSMYESVCKR